MEERGGLSRRRFRCGVLQHFSLFLKEGVRFRLMSGQKSVKPDPLHPSEGFGFIAGVFNHHRKAERLQFFFHFRVMENHGIFDYKITAFIKEKLVIRGIIFSRIEDTLFPEGFPQLRNSPGGFIGTCKTDPVQRATAQEQIRY